MTLELLSAPMQAWCWARLRGETTVMSTPDNWQEWAQQQGVLGLLVDASIAAGDRSVEPLLAPLAINQLKRDRAVDELAGALEGRNIRAVFFKGAALSRWLYQPAWLRMRSDSDVWIDAPDRAAASACLEALGYTPIAAANGPLVLGEQSFWRVDRSGFRHVVDLHWLLNSHPRLRDLLQIDAVWAHHERVDGRVAMPSRTDQLLMAVLHLYGHQRGQPPRAVWWVDLDRLWRALSDNERASCIETATALGISGLLAGALSGARERMTTPIDPAELAALHARGAGEPSAQLLRNRGRWRELIDELAALPNWRTRRAWLKDLLLPPADWRRARFGVALSPWALNWRRVRQHLKRR
jgi:hypothetical protein